MAHKPLKYDIQMLVINKKNYIFTIQYINILVLKKITYIKQNQSNKSYYVYISCNNTKDADEIYVIQSTNKDIVLARCVSRSKCASSEMY